MKKRLLSVVHGGPPGFSRSGAAGRGAADDGAEGLRGALQRQVIGEAAGLGEIISVVMDNTQMLYWLVV